MTREQTYEQSHEETHGQTRAEPCGAEGREQTRETAGARGRLPADGPRRIGVLGMGTYLPPGVRTNEEVALDAGVTAQWIGERTGVLTRRVAGPDEAASDLAANAVRSAVEAAGIDIADVGLLVCATSTPDELGPATACRVQAAVGAHHAVALDVAAACSGWLFAAKVAYDWLRGAEQDGYAVVVGAEAYSKFLDRADRGTSVLFADGAAASVLGPVESPYGFADFQLGSDGTQAGLVLIPGGGSRLPAGPATLADGSHHIRMDGRSVSRFIVDVLPRLITRALDRAGLGVDDIACFVCHQPNPVLLRRLGGELGIPPDRLVVVGDEVGNIGAASAAYALAAAADRHGLRPGDRVLLTVFGAGMTWGSALLTWSGAGALMPAPVSGSRTPAGLPSNDPTSAASPPDTSHPNTSERTLS